MGFGYLSIFLHKFRLCQHRNLQSHRHFQGNGLPQQSVNRAVSLHPEIPDNYSHWKERSA